VLAKVIEFCRKYKEDPMNDIEKVRGGQYCVLFWFGWLGLGWVVWFGLGGLGWIGGRSLLHRLALN
jgi:hypothetical protein